MREQITRALSLMKSDDPAAREEGLRLFRWLYDNREKLAANLWQGFKIASAILTIILFPSRFAEAAEILGELAE